MRLRAPRLRGREHEARLLVHLPVQRNMLRGLHGVRPVEERGGLKGSSASNWLCESDEGGEGGGGQKNRADILG